MEHGPVDLNALAALFVAGLQLPLQTRLTRRKSFLYNAGVVLAAAIVVVLANVAMVLHDLHLDLTREKIFTPSSQAMAVVDHLQQPVRVTYFYNGQDATGRRMRDVLEVMGRRNPLLEVKTVDPDRQPAIAQAYGLRLTNAA